MSAIKKIRERLTPLEAEKLGFKVRPNEVGRKKARYTLTESQLEELKKIKIDYLNNIPLSINATSTLVDCNGNVKLQWIKRSQEEEDRLKALKSAVDSLKSVIKPTELTERKFFKSNKKLINQYTLTDYHLGMMAWAEESGDNWNMKIAEDTLVKFFQKAIETSPSAESCIFAQMGDFLHWDGLDAVTPGNKHVLDADTRFTKLVRVAIRVIRKVIKMLLAKYKKVNVIMAEGNHDLASSVWLREVFNMFYENEPRVYIDTNPDPYYCLTFGKCCFFYHHGHKRSIKNIDSVFVGKFKKEFGKAEFAYGNTGHFHHDHKTETNLMILEQHRTLASKDAYASRGGYLSGRDSKVITYHKNYGEVGRITLNIKMLK